MAPTILVIEDNLSNMLLTSAVLRRAGYSVLQADGAERGIELAHSAKPAVILMDVALPGMDGLAATRVLKADPETSHIPVIVLTARAMKGDEEKAFAAGCDAYLTKPIDTQKLAEAVADMIALVASH
jgi:CheY-like chemotaxis protein